MMRTPTSMRRLALSAVAHFFGGNLFPLDTDMILRSELDALFADLERHANRHEPQRQRLQAIRPDSAVPKEQFVHDIYEAGLRQTEHATALYANANALLTARGFERITGIPLSKARELTFLDVGAGDNRLLRMLSEKYDVPHEQLTASDISAGGVKNIQAQGFTAYLGTITSVPPSARFDVVFLSYFIDYDTEQAATLKRAIDLLKPRGRLVIEAKLPCVMVYPSVTITRGIAAWDDARRIIAFIRSHAKRRGRTTSDLLVADGKRKVFFRAGICSYPSTFIAMTIS